MLGLYALIAYSRWAPSPQKPNNLLPVLIKESDSSTSYVYINKSTHEELLAACSWVVN